MRSEDDALALVEVERRIVAGQRQAGGVVRLDRAQVLPVAVEQVGLQTPIRQRAAEKTSMTRSCAGGCSASMSQRAARRKR